MPGNCIDGNRAVLPGTQAVVVQVVEARGGVQHAACSGVQQATAMQGDTACVSTCM